MPAMPPSMPLKLTSNVPSICNCGSGETALPQMRLLITVFCPLPLKQPFAPLLPANVLLRSVSVPLFVMALVPWLPEMIVFAMEY